MTMALKKIVRAYSNIVAGAFKTQPLSTWASSTLPHIGAFLGDSGGWWAQCLTCLSVEKEARHTKWLDISSQGVPIRVAMVPVVPRPDEWKRVWTLGFSGPFILVHPWLNPRCANVWWNGQHWNWWVWAYCVTQLAFHFFEQKNRVKLTGCVAQEWEDSSLRDTKVWAPYYGGLRVPLCRQHVSVSYWATGVGRSKGSDLPILSIKFVFATRQTQKLCTKMQLCSSREILLK